MLRPSRVLRRRRRVTAVVAVLAVTALTTAGTGEWAADRLIRDRIAAAAPGLGADLTVSAEGSALWDLARQQIPRLDLSSDDATLGRLGPVDVRIRLDDVRFGGRATTVDGATAEVTVPLGAVADAVQAAAPSVTVDGATADPQAGTVTVALGFGGAAQLTLRPTVTDGQVVVTAVSAQVLGQALAPERLAALTKGMDQGAGHAYPLGLHATSVQVEVDGLRIELTAGPGTLKRA
ncbi:LmeA family phospholipid-binding protein [Streptacidiphilus melanogenes]|uniref:LmeA family phospholipid-binding protein n=1 Tax=Streptacidiphilus melanogenes TaxID=411235 RepID=UPI00126A00F6|nr:LmeA family phospholipid-binding protein [Streptacidiphilus melanogenes]